jgi:hypothetical protein
MIRRAPQLASLTTIAVALTCAFGSSPASAEGSVSPLPGSDYAVESACSAPSPRHATCLALKLVPLTAAAREHSHPIGMVRAASQSGAPARSAAAGNFGLRPQDLHSAYSLPNAPETEQTVALVDAYNDPTAEADLKTYDEEFGLPACTTANGCFAKVGQTGSPSILPFPKTSLELEQAGESEEAEDAIGWGAEISLDIESAHATCEGCHILLVEANSTSYVDLEAAEQTAINLGAQEVSNSWGGPEQGVTVKGDETGPFNTPGVVITASGGDNGFLGWDAKHPEERGFTNYPAASPHVVAVGGTRLTLTKGVWTGESVWNGDGASGGGCSVQFTAPAWQQQAADWSSVGCANKRAVADVAADADPHTGFAITDSSSACESEEAVHWCTFGGTSLASPIIAAVYALAGGANGVSYPAKTLYENQRVAPGTLHDVTSGSNGECSSLPTKSGISSCAASQEAAASCAGHLSCLAATGYDGPTGVGTPDGILGFQPGQEEEASPHEESRPTPEQPSPPVKQAPATQVTPAPTPSAPAPVTIAPTLHVSGLSLTNSALVALNHHRPRISAVGFALTSNAAGRVHVSLLRRVRVHGHTRWSALPGGVSLSILTGRNSGHLNGRAGLPAGLYRLRITTSGGSGTQLAFHIG